MNIDRESTKFARQITLHRTWKCNFCLSWAFKNRICYNISVNKDHQSWRQDLTISGKTEYNHDFTASSEIKEQENYCLQFYMARQSCQYQHLYLESGFSAFLLSFLTINWYTLADDKRHFLSQTLITQRKVNSWTPKEPLCLVILSMPETDLALSQLLPLTNPLPKDTNLSVTGISPCNVTWFWCN